MTKLNANVRAWGDTSVYVLPAYSYVPSDLTAVPAAAADLGWLSEDGIAEAIARDKKEVKANGGKVVRVLRTSDSRSFKIQCLETRASVLGLTRPGSTPVSSGGTAEVQTITYTGTATAGTLPMTVPGYGTITPVYNVATTALATQLTALVGATVGVTGTPGSSYVVTFPSSLGNVPTIAAPYTAATGLTNSSVATTTPGVNATTVTNVKTSTAADQRVFILDMFDGLIQRRIIVPTGEVTDIADITHSGANETVYELTIQPYPASDGTMYIDITNDPAQAV